MRALGALQVTAVIGPHVCGRCYEVPDQLRAEVAERVPAAYAETSWGTPSLDIGAGVRWQLEQLGCTVVDATRCTLESEDLFSYRRQGQASGRLAGVVRLAPR
jgi:polyphenol oxidase